MSRRSLGHQDFHHFTRWMLYLYNHSRSQAEKSVVCDECHAVMGLCVLCAASIRYPLPQCYLVDLS